MISIAELPRLYSDSIPEQPKSTESLRVCLITVGDKTFALDLRHVREVFEPASITPVPGMPASLVGVANLRGTIIPLVDARPSLGVSPSAAERYAIVVRHMSHQVGLLIDAIPEIRTISPDDIVDSSALNASERRSFVSQLVKVGNRVSEVLELSALFASIEDADMETSVPDNQ